MNENVNILIAEDDEGHAALIIRNLRKAGLVNNIIHFHNGEETLDFLLKRGSGPHIANSESYLLLLDIRMPKVDGIEVLRVIKKEKELKKMPVFMVTTTDDPKEIENCHDLGCNSYISKPIEYEKFMNAIIQLGLFLLVIQIPEMQKHDG
jgi:CheY-like chemotaxis protein